MANRTSAGVTWLAPNWQGTDETATGAIGTQAVLQRRRTPFGGPRGTQVTWPNPHGFVGGVDDPTGLVHLGAREYDPAIGRFLSVDPLVDTADPQQMEGYAYANNNPTTFSDPTGRMYSYDFFGEAVPAYPTATPPPVPPHNPTPSHRAKQRHCSGWNLACRAKQAVHATVDWVDDHKAEIAGVTAGVAAGALCEVATGAVGSVGCLAFAGAVASMVDYTVSTTVEHRGSFSWGGLAVNGLVGAAGGVVMGGVGKVVGRALQPGARKLVGALTRRLGRGVVNAGRAAARRAASGGRSLAGRASSAGRAVVRRAASAGRAMARRAGSEEGIKRINAGIEGAGTAAVASAFNQMKASGSVNMTDLRIAAMGGFVSGAMYHDDPVVAGALGGLLSDVATQTKNVVMNGDSYDVAEVLTAVGAGAVAGYSGIAAERLTGSKGFGLFISTYLGVEDPTYLAHDP